MAICEWYNHLQKLLMMVVIGSWALANFGHIAIDEMSLRKTFEGSLQDYLKSLLNHAPRARLIEPSSIDSVSPFLANMLITVLSGLRNLWRSYFKYQQKENLIYYSTSESAAWGGLANGLSTISPTYHSTSVSKINSVIHTKNFIFDLHKKWIPAAELKRHHIFDSILNNIFLAKHIFICHSN